METPSGFFKPVRGGEELKMVQLYSGELLSGGERIIDTDALVASASQLVRDMETYVSQHGSAALVPYRLRMVGKINRPLNFLLDKWFASSKDALSCIQNDALRLTDFKEFGRFLSGLLEADPARKVNCLYDYRRQAQVLGKEEFWCLEFEENESNHALLLEALEEVSQANARMELEFHKIMRKLKEESEETTKRVDQVTQQLEAFAKNVQKIKEYREKANRSQLSESEKQELNRSVERIRQFKDHERDGLLAERETLQSNLQTLDLRRRLMGLYRDVCIVVNILISKRSSAILRESIRRMRKDFASLIENTAPPEIDQYVTYSDSSVERQERARLHALKELREAFAKLTRQLDPVLMLVHDFHYLTDAYRECELSTGACVALHRILRRAHAQLH